MKINQHILASIRFVAMLFSLTSLLVCSASAQQAERGSLLVTVSNKLSGEYLQKAQVRIERTNFEQNTDELGTAYFSGIPTGTHSVFVSYVGLGDNIVEVEIKPGEQANLTVELTETGVLQLETYVVSAEREGNAASQVRQKNADNLTNVIATDALGMLANDNPAEILTRMAGVYSVVAEEGLSARPTIRGMNSHMNAVTTDGAAFASGAQMSRSPLFTNIAASTFDEIEVTKAIRPDQPADSIGGRINFKTKSALTMKKGRHVVDYRIGGKWVPPFFDYTPRMRKPAVRPNITLGYRGVYDVFGGKRNLGITLNTVYMENITQRIEGNTMLDTLTKPSEVDGMPLFSERYNRLEHIQDRQLMIGSLRLDYMISPKSKFYFTYEWKKQDQNFDNAEHFRVNANAGMIKAARRFVEPFGGDTARGQVMMGSTVEWTRVLAPGEAYTYNGQDRTAPTAANRTSFKSQSTVFVAADKTHSFKFGGDSRLGAWTIDYGVAYSRMIRDFGNGYHGEIRTDDPSTWGMMHEFSASVYAIGWILDKTRSDEFPEFTQTAGNSINDPLSYDKDIRSEATTGKAKNRTGMAEMNISRQFAFLNLPIKLSMGSRATTLKMDQDSYGTRINYVGPDGIAGSGDEDISRFARTAATDSRLGYGDMVVWDLQKTMWSIRNETNLWKLDEYVTKRNKREGLQSAQEKTLAGYFQFQTRVGNLGILGGVRYEYTDPETWGYVRQENHAGDYNNGLITADERIDKEYYRVGGGKSYSDWFPSLHLRYEFTKNLVARASFSTAVGRPPISRLIPSLSTNTDLLTMTFGNPKLKPQYANSYDLSLEYYFKPLGVLSVGIFRKDISDFQFNSRITPEQINELGYDYDLIAGVYNMNNYDEYYAWVNGDKGRVDGIELSWEQQLTFLPWIFRGLSLAVNYTHLHTSGSYGDANGGENALVNFIPNTANIRLTYKYRGLTAYAQWAYMDRFMVAYNVDRRLSIDVLERKVLNVGLSYTFSNAFTVFALVNNVLDEPSRYIHKVSGLRRRTIYNGPFVSFGFNGRF